MRPCHVFGSSQINPYRANRAYTPKDAAKEALFGLHDHLGVSRRVVIQSSCHGTDNAAILDTLRARPDISCEGVS